MIVRKHRCWASEYENYFQAIQCRAEIQIYVTEENLTGCHFVCEASFFFSLGLILPSSFSVVVFTFQCRWVVAETLWGEKRILLRCSACSEREAKKKVEKKECENRYNDGNRALKLLETFPQKVWNAQCASWLFRWRCFSLAERF